MLSVTRILPVVPAIMAGALIPMGLLTRRDSQLLPGLEGPVGSLEGATASFYWSTLKVAHAQPHVPLISLAAPWTVHVEATPVWGTWQQWTPPQGPLSSPHEDVESSFWPSGLTAWDLLGTVAVLP